MPFVNVKELHDRTSEVLRQAAEGKAVFITRYGKPVAVLRDLSEEEREGLALFGHAEERSALEAARAEVLAGQVTPLSALVAEPRRAAKPRR